MLWLHEVVSLCYCIVLGRQISPWRCDFDDMPNNTCSFLQYENDKCGQFKVTEGRLFGHPGPEHTNTHDRGKNMLSEVILQGIVID